MNWKNLIPFKWLKSKIENSMHDHLGKDSATRINGYLMTALIYLITFVVVGTELYSAYKGFSGSTHSYTPSNQLLAMAGLIFGQQALLFQLKRKGEETSFPTLEKMKNTSLELDSEPITEPTKIEDDFSEYNEELNCENCDCEGECKLGKDAV